MSAFGRPNAFGGTTGTTTGFGALNQQNQNSLFGTSTTGFGTNTTSNSLFGQPQPSTSASLFGSTSTQPQPVFGTSTAATGFGTGNTLFSGTSTMNNTQSLFGGNKFSTPSSNLFGSTPSTGLGGFSTVSNVTGTVIKFNPLLSTDVMIKNGTNQNINTRHQCITCMKEYENKSLEELRYEDYQANRKGGATSTMFGTTTNQPATSSLFGSQPSNTVSFNTANTASNSLFNTTKPTFGAPSTTTATTSIFNSTFNKSSYNANAFGTTTQQPTQTSSLFGTAPTTNTTGFGQQPTNNLFNITSQPNTATNAPKTSFFSTPATTQPNSLFGGTPNNALGAPKPMFGTGTSAFGAPTSSTSSFNFNTGATQAATTSTSLFSNNQGTGTSLFNTGTASTQPKSMFNFPTQNTGLTTQNALNTAGQQATNSLFGNTGGLGTTNLAAGTTSLFGNTNTVGTTNSLFGGNTSGANLFGSTAPNQSAMLSLQQISSPSNQHNNDLLMNRLQSLPYGSSSLFQNKVTGSSNSGSNLKFTTYPKVLNKYKVSFANSSSSQVQRVPSSSIKNTSLLFDGLDDDNPDDKKTAFNIFVPRKNIKKLTIKPKENLNASSSSALNSSTNEETANTNKQQQQTIPSLKLQLTANTQKKSTNDTTVNPDNTVLEYFRPQPPKAFSSTPAVGNNNQANSNHLNVAASSSTSPLNTIQSPAQSVILPDRNSTCKVAHHNHPHNLAINSPETSVTSLNDSQNYSILGHNSGDTCPSPAPNATFIIPRCKVILTRTEYFTIPPLDQLDVEDETCFVESFTVGRHGYGSIYWEGPLDIYGLNLDEIVHIRRKEVIVYPDDENKPEEGFGLNRPAQITLHKVWPVDKSTHELIKDPQRLIKMNYSEKIENATIKFGGIFKEYRPDTGSWVFKVKHFSKYGLVEENQMQTDHQRQHQQQQPPTMGFQSTQTDSKQFVNRENIENYYPQFDIQQSQHFFGRPSPSLQHHHQQQHQQGPVNDRIFLNLDEDETTTEGLDEEDEEIIDDFNSYPEEIPVANTYNYMLRNVLFENEDKLNVDPDYEKSAKKTKMLLKPEIMVDHDDYFDKHAASFSFIQPQYTPKLDIILKPDDYVCKEKIYYDISSIKCSKVSKVRFTNGLNNFIFIDGRNVNIYKLQLIPELATGNLKERFNLQMNYNSEICLPTNDKTPYVQVKPTIENKYNIDCLEKLVKALYGSLDSIATEHEYNQERQNRIIDWLTEQNRKLPRPANLYDRIVYYLASNEIKQAVDDLIAANHPKLAILLCSGNNFAIKNNICQQLLEWKTLQGDTFISSDLLKIYVLLSGETRYRLSNNHQIDILEKLTWTQQLALLLLYSVETDLASCVANITCETNDVEYHLIANHDPLVAMSSAENDLEAWWPEVNSNVQHGLLAAQLVRQDIRWACYVACHITHDLLREYTLKELLFAFVEQLNSEKEEWLKRQLGLSPKYIASVKAIHSKSKFDFASYGTELLDCEEWIEAHDVLVEHIFPELVINEEHEKLCALIDKLKPYNELIPNWYMSGAHLFDIYAQCVNSERITEELINQPFNIRLMKCTNNRQRLCQSEMARKINLIYHEFNKTKFMMNLPVPSDYSLRELQFNTRSTLKELCS